MYDFIIFFEHQARELENAVLLEEYLNRQGYSVCILRVNSYKMLYKRAKVIIVPYCYNDDDVFTFVCFPFYKPTKIINLQYEQIFTESDENNGSLYPSESAQKCQIVSWGDHSYYKLIDCGINPLNIHKIGNFALDFNSDRFNEYFISRQAIAQKYGLPMNKVWHLFISSFSFVDLEEEHINKLKSIIPDIDKRIEMNIDSQKQILGWFKKALKDNEDICIIYRPHPAENVSKIVKEFEKNTPNFFVIGDYSIRQWIRVSDSISNWYSTSLIDIYFSQKNSLILRPILISNDEELLIMKDASFVTSYESFNEFIKDHESISFPVEEKKIKEFFYNTFDGECYKMLGDLCIDVLKNDNLVFDYKESLGFSVFYYFKMYIWLIVMFFASHFNLSNILPKKYRTQLFYMYKESRGYSSKIKQIKNRLVKVLDEE